MKLIFSHDVDHLYSRDHWFRDAVYPKLWIRETGNFFGGRISSREWRRRMLSCFKHERNCISELLIFDKENGIRSTYFFGMNKGLGMSYKPHEAEDMILFVKNSGFDVGVHGICFENIQGIKKERKAFFDLLGFVPTGIRMHYVRYNQETFENLNKAGYLFDSTEFDKSLGYCIKDPYRIGNMWEFPICVMDSYLPYNLGEAKKFTIKALQTAEENSLEYFTILFHDPYYGEEYKEYKQWYQWLVSYVHDMNMENISFMDAVKELLQNV